MPLVPHLDLPFSKTAHARLKLDLYLPPPSEPCRGLIVFVHGGAWRSSSSRDPTLAGLPSLLPQDYALAIPNYRLSGQADGERIRWPAHTLDVKEAVEWLVGEGAAGGLLAGDGWRAARERVWFVGHSAGAVRPSSSSSSGARFPRASKPGVLTLLPAAEAAHHRPLPAAAPGAARVRARAAGDVPGLPPFGAHRRRASVLSCQVSQDRC